MNFQAALEFYNQQRKKILALNYADFLIEWDTQTEAAEKSILADAEYGAILSEMSYNLNSDPRFGEAIEVLYANRDKLEAAFLHEVETVKRRIEKTKKIPVREYVAFGELTSRGYPLYVRAKKENNFDLFCPVLQQVVDYNRKLIGWWQRDDLRGYDVLLDVYEPHYTQKQYDVFFDLLRQKLVPVIQSATKNVPPVPQWATQIFPREQQRKFCEYLREVMCFDKARGLMKESEHPFTSGFGTNDVRITNHYYEDNFVSAIFSAIHETGHALYETQVDASFDGTFCSGGASLGLHESQSRFYENMVGRNPAFWRVHYPVLQQYFPQQMAQVSLDEFLSYVNRAECSYVRTEADELTYPLHIMLRYEIEKKLMDGTLAVADLPTYWKDKFTQYFGITPPTDTLGVLQDVHWAYGDFGYFPTYALGSAIAAQLWHAMNKDFDVEASLAVGTTAQINDWLAKHVHKYGSSKYPDEILLLATGEPFNPNYYIDYLIKKYCK